MIKRVFGSSNGINVIFTQTGNKWEVSVPVTESGEFVIDVYAEDMAGNMGYCATILYTIDLNKLSVAVKILNFNSDIKFENLGYHAKSHIKNYASRFTKKEGGCMLKVFEGERRTIYIDITSEDESIFEIASAQFKVYRERTHELVTEGVCNIDGHQLSHQVQFSRAGLYDIHYILRIGNDVIIKRQKIKVERCHEIV